MSRPSRPARALLCVLLLLGSDSAHAKKKKKRRGELSTYTPLTLQVGVGNQGEQSALKLKLPPESKGVAITSPQQLVKSMGHAWDTVVAPHQAGLADAKAGHVAAAPLSDGEAWHHFQAGQAGVIDSARFLVAFGVVPSLQTGGGKLHAAAARGLLPTVLALLDAGDTQVRLALVNTCRVAPSVDLVRVRGRILTGGNNKPA